MGSQKNRMEQGLSQGLSQGEQQKIFSFSAARTGGGFAGRHNCPIKYAERTFRCAPVDYAVPRSARRRAKVPDSTRKRGAHRHRQSHRGH